MIVEIPVPPRDMLAKFSKSELDSLRRMLTSPEYQKLLSISECVKPSANCTGAGSGPRDAFSNERATARLGEIRGWEMHQAALLLALAPKQRRKAVTENFQPVQPNSETE